MLTNSAGSTTIQCGNASASVTIISYKPAFTLPSFGGTTGGVTLQFSTAAGVT